MNRFLSLGVAVLALVYVSTTAFQCGSAETTSAKLYMQQKQWDKAEAEPSQRSDEKRARMRKPGSCSGRSASR